MLFDALYSWKAISQNLIHSNLSITDGIYGILSEIDVRTKIATLEYNKNLKKKYESKELVSIAMVLLERLRTN